MELREIVERAFFGQSSLDELSSWVKSNQDRYRKPPFPLSDSGTDFDQLVDEYSDWEIRIQELVRHLNELRKTIFDAASSDQILLNASIVYSLSQLDGTTLSQAQGLFIRGYALWKAKEYYDGAEMLSQATDLFRSLQNPLMEVTALSFRCDCLHQHKQFDETITCANDLHERAQAYGFRGHEASALRDLGMAHSQLGRKNESLESLRKATILRRSLSDEEVSEQNVTSLPAFLDSLGAAARKFGRFDEAFSAFLEARDIHRQEGNTHLEALALSEVGYTYLNAGEAGKAAEYLRLAIPLEAQAGPTSNSHRWKMQVAVISGNKVELAADEISMLEEFIKDDDRGIKLDAASAYLFAEQALNLVNLGNYEKAADVVSRVLRWATRQRDVHCQVVCRNVLGTAYDHLGRFKDAVSEFQQAIALADGGGGPKSASLVLRYNLAKVYDKQRDFQSATEVLQAGIAHSQWMLTQSESFAVRQQVVSGALPLYELFAFLLSRADAKPNHETLLAITDVVRARNMASWARTRAQFDSETISKDVTRNIEERLQQLRAAEVELDLRHLGGSLTPANGEALQRRTEMLQGEIERIAAKVGVEIISSKSPQSWEPFKQMESALAAVLSPGTAVLSLFSVPEGICPSIFYRDEEGIKTGGSFIAWDRNERLNTLARWTGEAAILRSRSTGQKTRDEVEKTARFGSSNHAPEQLLDDCLKLTQERLFTNLVDLIRRFQPRQLAVIPHRELALIPYWSLVDSCDLESFTLVPSLDLFQICVNRSRGFEGGTIVVPDVTCTLPKTQYEIETVKKARKGGIETVRSADQLLKFGPQSNLLHIAAHGAHNAKNPYHSGYVMDQSQTVHELFAQYVKLVSSNGQVKFEFSDILQANSFQLMTVAECMARLSLKECRLAVLSACECGLADPHAGGELTGLPTSLLVAGAKSVIAALWPVDDAATAILMSRFYNHWVGGFGDQPSAARSVALARKDLQQMGRKAVFDLLGPDTWLPRADPPFAHPLYSDAFQCYGDW